MESLNHYDIWLFLAGLGMIGILSVLTLSLYYGGIRLEEQYITEAINGIASTVALILGFTGLILTILLQRVVEYWKSYVRALVFGIFASLVVPISALFGSYISLFGGYFHRAVDGAILSLLSSTTILIILLCLIVWILGKKWVE